MNFGEKQLVVTARADGRYSYSLGDGDSAVGSGGVGLGWGEVKNLLECLAPKNTELGKEMKAVIASAREGQKLNSDRTLTAVDQERRLECVKLAIQAGVQPHEVIKWASALADWIACKPAE